MSDTSIRLIQPEKNAEYEEYEEYEANR